MWQLHNFCLKIQHLGLKPPFLENLVEKIEIFSTHNILWQKLAAVCWNYVENLPLSGPTCLLRWLNVCMLVCAVLKQQHDKMAQQQAIIQQAITQQSIRTAPWQQSSAVPNNVLQEQLDQQRAVAMEQIQQSEANLAAQYQSIMQQQQVE